MNVYYTWTYTLCMNHEYTRKSTQEVIFSLLIGTLFSLRISINEIRTRYIVLYFPLCCFNI